MHSRQYLLNTPLIYPHLFHAEKKTKMKKKSLSGGAAFRDLHMNGVNGSYGHEAAEPQHRSRGRRRRQQQQCFFPRCGGVAPLRRQALVINKCWPEHSPENRRPRRAARSGSVQAGLETSASPPKPVPPVVSNFVGLCLHATRRRFPGRRWICSCRWQHDTVRKKVHD